MVAVVSAAIYFQTGLETLFRAWATPEYSHGPLIPILSLFLFLRQLKSVPINTAPVTDRTPGVMVLIFALLLGGVGRMIQIPDFAAYAIILWVGGLILVSFGWRDGRQFWPPVLHLVYMLPLPGVLYYGLSTYLQGVSSELGVWMLRLIDVPVYLEGNIIDLGVYKLQVAEACSGLRYLFPILSFSYIFAVLYRGPMWHKAILLVSAVPITVFMNSVRIAIAGAVVDHFGLSFVEGVTHFMEGWVIFVTCVLILFALAWLLLRLHPEKHSLVAALDLETAGLGPQFRRIGLVRPSKELIGVALLVSALAAAWQVIPPRQLSQVQREPFYLFPRQVGDWSVGESARLTPDIARILAADDYISAPLTRPGTPQAVDLFVAWYRDQMTGGTHSPTVCLPGAGWEIASLETIKVSKDLGGARPFTLKRAIIQKGVERMLVYYWYDQQGVNTASSYYAKLTLTKAKVLTGRSDGALVRLITPINSGNDVAAAEARLQDALRAVIKPLNRFVPG
ncbi:transmembrane exosortase [Defluviimonas sp. 20V17]|nr:transmembrane exosortase [Defluviimonas sp. 20V17]